jgi:hypothetical protein
MNLNTTGSANTAIGIDAIRYATDGDNNTAVGAAALIGLTHGGQNTAVGNNAGSNITTGTNNIVIGHNAQASSATVSNEITLGNGNITTLRSNVNSISSLSDARDKKNINDISVGLNFVKALKPRVFNWDKREWYSNKVSDGSKTSKDFTAGFIAQELDATQQQFNANFLNLVYKTSPEKWEATYGNLLPVIVKSIQELSAEKDKQIMELEKRIQQLEALIKQK